MTRWHIGVCFFFGFRVWKTRFLGCQTCINFIPTCRSGIPWFFCIWCIWWGVIIITWDASDGHYRTWGLLSSHYYHKNKAIPEPVLVGCRSTWRIWMIGACNSWCSSLNPWLPERKPMRESCRMPFGGEIIEGIIVTRTTKSQFFFEPATKTHYGSQQLSLGNPIECHWIWMRQWQFSIGI